MIPNSWVTPKWCGRESINHPVNWGILPEFEVGIGFLQEKKPHGHDNTWFLIFRNRVTGETITRPVLAQTVVTSSPGSTQTLTSSATWNNTNNTVCAIGGGADGGIGASTSTSGGGGGGGAFTLIYNMTFATPGTTQYFVRVGAHGIPAGTVGDSWLTQTTPGTTYPVASEVGLGAKGGAPLAAASTATGSAGGASGSAYTNPSTGAIKKSGGTGGNSGASNSLGGAGGGAGGQNGDGVTPANSTASAQAGGAGNNNQNGGGTGGPAGNNPSAGGNGTNISAVTGTLVGSGGGGGGANAGPGTGGAGGNYGGGGGGGGRSNGTKGLGIQGAVVLTWDLVWGWDSVGTQNPYIPTPRGAGGSPS